jgi:hypothetical protein
VGVGGTPGRLIKLGERERRAKAEAAGVPLSCNLERVLERFLGGAEVCCILPQQNLAGKSVQEDVAPMLFGFLRERQPLVDAHQSGLQVSRLCLELREETLVEWRKVLITLIHVDR